ncbi:mandelate racemase/muconate lactonizing enzyme family protein [Streptomyces sp. CA-288835]|uniref:mandelate racemase/muconate lactonizing enzyme family protein n=1 Tax=Streptomyces sp. CA-288835 TaxID=3240069 RepID=UPI003D927D59
MRITGYRSLTTAQHWGQPVGDANGVYVDGVVPVPVVIVETGEGITGVGLGPHVEAEVIFAVGVVFGTIGTFDTALWDIKAQAVGEPLWRLLGGDDRMVHAYASGLDIGLTDDEPVATYHGTRPGLMLDANESWSRKQAVRHVGELERTLDLTWIEEPVRRWDADGLAAVSRGVRTAVASGENLTGLEQFRPLIAAGGVDIVQTAAVWGVTHFLRVAALAHAYDLPASPIGNTPVALLHAATSVPNHLVSELQGLQPPIGVSMDLHVEDGAFVLGDMPGLGIRIDETVMTAARQRTAHAPDGPHIRPEQAGRRLLAVTPGPCRSTAEGTFDTMGMEDR